MNKVVDLVRNYKLISYNLLTISLKEYCHYLIHSCWPNSTKAKLVCISTY